MIRASQFSVHSPGLNKEIDCLFIRSEGADVVLGRYLSAQAASWSEILSTGFLEVRTEAVTIMIAFQGYTWAPLDLATTDKSYAVDRVILNGCRYLQVAPDPKGDIDNRG